MKITLSIDINAPPQAVFEWVGNPEKAMQWQQGVAETEYISKTENMVGTTFRETMVEGGNKLEMQGEVTGYAPGRSISFHISSRIHDFDVTYAVQGIPAGSRIAVSTNIQWKFPMSVMTLIAGGKIKANIISQTQAELRRLKELCEGSP